VGNPSSVSDELSLVKPAAMVECVVGELLDKAEPVGNYVVADDLADELDVPVERLERLAKKISDNGENEDWVHDDDGGERVLLHPELVGLICAKIKLEQAYGGVDSGRRRSKRTVNSLVGDPAEQFIFDEIGSHDLLTPEEERWLLEHRGERAASDELVEANLRLVANIAARYQGRGLPLADLIQEGTIGLMTAIEKFDLSRGFKLSTYATWWISQAMRRAIIEQVPLVRLPEYAVARLRLGRKYMEQVMGEEQRIPAGDEVAKEIGITLEDWQEVCRAAQEIFELDRPAAFALEQGRAVTAANQIANSESGDPANESDKMIIWRRLDAIMRKTLSDLQYQAVRLHYGLDRGGDMRVLAEVGTMLKGGVTREYVRQLVSNARERLRRIPEACELMRDLLMMEGEEPQQKFSERSVR
jgi:RNA polymerase primary sigma factor